MVSSERFGIIRGARKGTVRVFLLTLAATLLAKGSSFLPGYAIDDYGLVLQEALPVTMLGQGRFGQVALIEFFRLLGLEAHSARVFFVAFAIVVSSLLAVLIVRFWNLKAAGWLAAAGALIIAIHPFTTEIFTFRAALGIITCAFALLAILLVPRRWSVAGVAAGAILFAVALSVYQAILQHCMMIVFMGVAIGLTRLLVAGNAAGWPRRITSLLSPRRMVRSRNAALLACAALGTAGYVLVNAVIVRLLRVTMGQRFGFLPYDRIGERMEAVLNVLRYRFLEPSPLLNPFSKRLLLLFLLAALLGLLLRARPWRLRPALLLLAVVALLAAGVVWTVGIAAVPPTFWPVPRVMSHAGVFWAGALAISFLCAGARVRWGLGLLALLIVLAFIGSDNRILNDQLRLNARDAAKASRIVARLEALPGFSAAESVAIHGTAPAYPLAYPTSDMDMNLSAFSAEWARLAILRETSGYDLKEAKSPLQKDAAAKYCQQARPWPDARSVAIQDRLAIVCLGPGHP